MKYLAPIYTFLFIATAMPEPTEAFFGVVPRQHSRRLSGAYSSRRGDKIRRTQNANINCGRGVDTQPRSGIKRRLSSTTAIYLGRSDSGDHNDQNQRNHEPTNHEPTCSKGDKHQQQLVLKEFTMASAPEVPGNLFVDPAVYERRVRAECLREGGETATVVRWHISRVDDETGEAYVEAVFLVPSVPVAPVVAA